MPEPGTEQYEAVVKQLKDDPAFLAAIEKAAGVSTPGGTGDAEARHGVVVAAPQHAAAAAAAAAAA